MLRRVRASSAALAIAAALTPWPCHAQTADAPSLISFQGRLTDTQSNPLGGNHNFVFAVYPALAGGSALWTETQNAVTVTNGVLSVQLGAVTPIPSDVFRLDQAYLQITVDGAPLTPRQRLVSAPYALNSRLLKGRDFEALVSTDAAQTVGGQKTFLLQLSVSSDVYLSAGQINVQGNRLTTPGGLLDAGKLTNALPALDGSALTGISATRVSAGGVDLSTVTTALAGKLSSTAGIAPGLVDLSTVTTALSGKLAVGGNAANITGNLSTSQIDLSTISTALAGKLSAGAAVAPGQVDLSTVTAALAGKLSSTAGIAPGLVDLSTVTTALAGKLSVGAGLSTGQVDLSTVTTALAGKLSSTAGIAPGLVDLSTVTTALAGKLAVGGNAANITGNLSTSQIDLSTITTALAGKLSAGAAVTPGQVDLSTVTAALAGKLSSTAGIAPGLVDLSTVTTALAGKLSVGAGLSAGQVDLSTVTTALTGKLSSTAGIAPGLVDLSTVTTALAGKLAVGGNAANITGNLSTAQIDLSTITTALAGKLSAGAAVAPGQVDLSTVTAALAGKLSSTAGIAPGLVDLSTVTTALAGKLAVGGNAANITGNLSTSQIDLSTITTALAGKLSAGAAVTPGQVDLSTVTTALAGKLSSAAGIAPGLVDLSTVTTALAGKLAVGGNAANITGNLSTSQIDLSTVTAALAGKLSSTAGIAPGLVDLSTVTTSLAGKLSTSGGGVTGALSISGSSLSVNGAGMSVSGDAVFGPDSARSTITATGKILLPNGTQGAPAYSFGSSPNSGMYLVEGNPNIEFSAGGQRRFLINTNGQINMPSGSAAVPGLSDITNQNAGLFMGNRFVAVTTDGSERLRATADGRVGVGTGSPAARLHVSSPTANASESVLLVSSGTGVGQELLTVMGDGKAGFGTSSPATKLHVKGAGNNTYLALVESTENNSYLKFKNASSGAGDLSSGGLIGLDAGVDLLLWNAENGKLRLATNGTERITVLGGGNVGVGATVPLSKLHVLDGDIRVSTGIGQASRGIIFQDGSVQTTAATGGAGETNTFASSKTVYGTLLATNSVRSTGWTATPGGAGAGVELMYITPNSAGSLLAYDRDASRYKTLDYYGSDHRFYTNQSSNISAVLAGDGSLGLGTYPTDASARLHVSSASASATDTLLKVSSGTGVGQELLVVRGDGKVGVGTAVPTSTLTVAGPLNLTGTAAGPLASHGGVTLASVMGGAGQHTTSGSGGVILARQDSNSFGTGVNELVYLAGSNTNSDALNNNSGQTNSVLLFGRATNLRDSGDDKGLVLIAGKADQHCITSGGGVSIAGECSTAYLDHGGGAGKAQLFGDVDSIYSQNGAPGGGYFTGVGRTASVAGNSGSDNPNAAGSALLIGRATGGVTTSAGEFLVVSSQTTGTVTPVGTNSLAVLGNGARSRVASGYGYGGGSRGANSVVLEFRDFKPLEQMATGNGLTVTDGDLRISTTTGSKGIIFQDGTVQTTAGLGETNTYASTKTIIGSLGVGSAALENGTLVVKSTTTTAANPVLRVLNNSSAELFRFQTDGRLGVWGSDSAEIAKSFTSAYSEISNSWMTRIHGGSSGGLFVSGNDLAMSANKGTISVFSESAVFDNGGSVALGGKDDSGNFRTHAIIKSGKENQGWGNSQPYGYLTFGTRPSGGNVTERLRITSFGQVGVGTASPQARLHVSSPSATSSDALLLVSSGTGAGQEIIVVKGDGNVGIGNTNPSERLHLERGDASNSYILLKNTNAGGYGAGFRLQTPDRNWVLAATDNAAGVDNAGAFVLQDESQGQTRLVVNSAGFMGVGTVTPGQKLEVEGGAIIAKSFGNRAGGTGSALEIGYDGTKSVLQSYDRTASGYRPTYLSASSFQFDQGNVGIGTANPPTKLDVVGDAQFGAGVLKSTFTATPGSSQYALDLSSGLNVARGPVVLNTGGFVRFADGTTQNTAASSGSGVPAGAVMHFNLASCPSGWSALVAAQGRYLVGLPSGGTLAGTSGTALTNLESRASGTHAHTITDPGHNHTMLYGADGGGGNSAVEAAQEVSSLTTGSTVTGITINNSGTVAGTNAPYVQLLVCQKD